MNYRLDYINQLEEENRGLWSQLLGLKPRTDAYEQVMREIRANNEEIAIMKQLEGASNGQV